MALTNYVTLGRSGLRVSPMCLGAMTFGEQWGWGSDDETATAVLEHYLERGGNFIDTANIYTKGYSEAFIGSYFAGRKSTVSNPPRDRVVLATKFMGNMYLRDPNGGGAGRKSIIAACEQSLRRLQTDYIDLYWAHFWDQHTPLEEMVRALDDLVRSGKVRYVGLSDHPAWVCAKCQHLAQELRAGHFIALQIEYSLAQRTVEGELMPMARHYGMGVTPWSPLKGGILSGKFTRNNHPTEDTRTKPENRHLSDKNYAIIDELIAIAKEASATPAQIALRWLSLQPGVSSIIIGARKLSQLQENLSALEVTLSEEQLQRLDTASAVEQAFPFDFVHNLKTAIHGGTSINGEQREPWPLAPKDDQERY
ncbi:MAG: aldo/keto reductase [Bdellovibrionales bacterium]|nr:aldo/keto reductase [Bdellovibrionales bacterium]